MSYRAGMGASLAARLEAPELAGGPRIICDWCGATRSVTKAWGEPYRWFLAKKPPPGWKGERYEDGTRQDFCPACIAKWDTKEEP